MLRRSRDENQNPDWTSSASGLERISSARPHAYAAPDFDALYDSPILLGNLDSLPSFDIRGVPHHFIGFKLGADKFNAAEFMKDLKAVVEQGIAVIGEIPYQHYSFMIG